MNSLTHSPSSHPPLRHGPIITTGADSDFVLEVTIDLAHTFGVPRLRALELSNKRQLAVKLGRRFGLDALVLAGLIVTIEGLPVHKIIRHGS
jgi:hypothetical protein